MKPVRVLIVDDSPTIQAVLSRILSTDPSILVVGVASDPFEAKELILEKHPDVITLDVEMPRMDGITFLKRLMASRPIPVVMLSSYTLEGSRRTLEALDAGAVDFVAKPLGDIRTGLRQLSLEIVTKVKAAAQVKVGPARILPQKRHLPLPMTHSGPDHVIAIGASTGGIQAISALMAALPPDMDGMVIVQHMPPHFTKAFAERLNGRFPLDIKEAQNGDRMERGRVFVAPGGYHLVMHRDPAGFILSLDDGPPVRHQRPSVDVLFRSVAESAGPRAIGIILTGMGEDGADGLLAMKRAGAYTIAQDKSSSAIFGMPRASIARGAVDVIATLDEIPDVLLSRLQRHS